MLTPEEKQACREAPCTRDAHHGYGHPRIGPCPIAAVAVLRGATLYVSPETGSYSFMNLRPHTDGGWVDMAEGHDLQIYGDAEQDVLAWTGYAAIREFLEALGTQGTAIFPAAEVPA